MKSTHIALSALILCAACGGESPPAPSQAAIDSALAGANAEIATSESARLNAFFETKFEEALARSPMQQTFLGRKTNYDKWDEPSDENALKELELQRQAVAEMRAEFDVEQLDPQAALSYRLFEYQLEQAERDYKYRDHQLVFNQMRGSHSAIPAFLINQHRIQTKEDAEAYLARLRSVPEYLGAFVERSKKNAENGVLAPRFVYDYVIEASENVINGYPYGGRTPTVKSPLYDDFEKKVRAITLQDGEFGELMFGVRDAITRSVVPAYLEMIDEMKRQRDLAGDDDGVWRLPDGANYYAARLANMTTTAMTAEDIHQLGLSEMDRIHGEMREIMQSVGYEGTLQDFFDYLRTDPQFFKPETDEGRAEYLAEATALIDTMRDALPQMFNTFPEADLIVKRVEEFREKGAGKAFYQRPAADGSRPGIYYTNLYTMSAMPVYQMEALAYHEGIPGHHMQLAISQELEGIPKFRKFGGYTAYTEGWGLYSEYLPKEFGFYEDPYSDFGRLAMELWRAARLVVDTGLHDKKWTRQEAIDYLLTNTPNPESDCRKAIDRYIVMPGQATAYKIGMLKILELREKAKTALGERFSIAAFHDEVLKDGPVPLAVLEEKIDTWIARERA